MTGKPFEKKVGVEFALLRRHHHAVSVRRNLAVVARALSSLLAVRVLETPTRGTKIMRPSNRLSNGVHAPSLHRSIASNISLSGSFFFDSLAAKPLSGQAHEICGGCIGAAAVLESAPATTEVRDIACITRCVFF